MSFNPREVEDQIEQDVLQPPIIVKAIGKAMRLLHDPVEQPDARRELLQKELEQLKRELTSLTTAIAAGGALQTLLGVVQERGSRQTEVQAELAFLNGITVTPFNAEEAEHELRGYLKDWSGLAQRHPAQARQIVRKFLPDKQRIRAWHEGNGHYRFTGVAVLGRGIQRFGRG